MQDHDHNISIDIALGAAAGLAATFALQGIMTVKQKLAPSAAAPIKKDPGEFMVQQAERLLPASAMQKIPDTVETAASKSLHIGYGMMFGALYGLLRPRGGSILRNGALLGLVTWATGYLGWLPASGLMEPIWRHRPRQILVPAAENMAYGAAAVGAYEALHEWV
jgi:hypothetical protein